MKYLITAILSACFLSLSLAQTDSTSIPLDTMKTADANTFLLYQETETDEGAKNIHVISILADGITLSIRDTTILLSQSDSKRRFYLKKKGEEIFYTKLPDGGRYESYRTGHTVEMSEQIKILKCIYSNIEYPERAIQASLEGKFQLEFYVNTSGCIQDILLKGYGHDLLVEAAKRAAKKCDCQFPVLKKEESKFPTYLILPMKFKLE